jgi:phage tail sheath gpL-like
MTITYPNYPSSNRVPGVFADIDPSDANTATVNLRALIVAQMTPAGSATAGTPVIVPSPSAALAMFGAGSQAAIAVQHYRNIDQFGELWVLPLTDDPAAQAAAGSIGMTGTATASGTIVFEIDGVLVPVAYMSGDTASTVLGRIAPAMALVQGIPLAAGAVAAGALPLTALNKGACGNDILLGMSDTSTDYVSAGLTITLIQPTGGSQNPSTLSTSLQALGNKAYDFICCPYTDTASLAAWKAFMNTSVGRWSWSQMLFGMVFAAIRGQLGDGVSFGDAQNDETHSFMGPIADSPHSPLRWAAEVTAGVAVKCRTDPAIPITQVALTVSPPSDGNQWDLSERNSLLYAGMSTFVVADDGTVSIDRMITSYQTNAQGAPDNSYLDVETMDTLAYVIRDLQAFQLPYLTMKLVSDGTPIPYGSNCTSAPVVKQALISEYARLQGLGYVQNSTTFAQNIVVTNAGNGLLQEGLRIDVANQVRDIAMLIQFRKS